MRNFGCPSGSDIARMIEGGLDPEYSEKIRTHLKSCYACESLFALGTAAIRGTGEFPLQNPLEIRNPTAVTPRF